ncbi:MAG: hypothetical protein OXI59_13800 [Gemmatimonadota bacterium]|nr:hypothetical protein [Gemmatimonadota bacterium]
MPVRTISELKKTLDGLFRPGIPQFSAPHKEFLLDLLDTLQASPYQFYQSERLIVPELSETVQIPGSGEGYKWSLLTRKIYAEGLITGPFHTSYEGAITFTCPDMANATGNLSIAVIHHFQNGQSLTSRRSTTFIARRSERIHVGFNEWNSITQLALGTIRDDNGDNLKITRELLSQPIEIAMDAELTVTVRGVRKSYAFEGITSERPRVTFWQLNNLDL